jgi:DNA-binding MarR family transcriptional regulator
MYTDLDPLLHSQLRLAIISMLVASDKVEFTDIQSETKAAAGNISIQIKKLEDAGYIKVEKTFKNNYPNTILSITDQGIKAFESYVSNLKKYINPRKQFLS